MLSVSRQVFFILSVEQVHVHLSSLLQLSKKRYSTFHIPIYTRFISQSHVHTVRYLLSLNPLGSYLLVYLACSLPRHDPGRTSQETSLSRTSSASCRLHSSCCSGGSSYCSQLLIFPLEGLSPRHFRSEFHSSYID